MADSIIPAGQITRVEGGYRISGNWPFVSGIDHSTWAMLAGMMPEPATGPFDFGPRLFLLPHSDFAIEDTWFVAGLEASGSQNVVVKDALCSLNFRNWVIVSGLRRLLLLLFIIPGL